MLATFKKLSFGLLFACAGITSLQAQPFKTKNVVIVTLDGFRWQEIYRGADSVLLNNPKFSPDADDVKKLFWATTPEQRRQKLLPFIWSTVAQQGQLYGNRDMGAADQVANIYNFSYPGYNEIFTGFPDVNMNTNDPIPNPNLNILEFLNKQKGFENKVAAFTSWETFPAILNVKRSGLLVNSGFMDLKLNDAGDRIAFVNQFQRTVPKLLGDDTRLDFATYLMGKTYMDQYKPRVIYFAFDETDDMAHDGNYKMYLREAHQEDAFLAELWNKIQSDPFYKDQTTLIITCDHGRGEKDPSTWTSHGQKLPESAQTWVAVIGPDSPAKGIVHNGVTTYHKQLAQTIATLLGFDFKAQAGHPVGDAITTILGK